MGNARNWITRHRKDPFVKEAKGAGYRSRAAYKLLELQRRDGLFRRGDTVVDLGAAPGGWSQVARELVGGAGRVIAVDILPMAPLPGVILLAGDILDPELEGRIATLLAGTPARVVISDMAPNITGLNALDQPRALQMAESALEVGCRILAPGGSFLVKVFQGEGFDAFVKGVRGAFAKTCIRKPKASRASSREVYVLGICRT
uniref:Ribosomal RNA large subunit methyltransferase E n=1 Tax=Candidatus Kentrum sp. FM TaxID=2126340 RepID=A0A450TJ00_9GAMM|nr:MAG: 23S rRNA (uridine2552-2'-O)-methyltransferase [Candidatus Kentron sp. FM]VFJ67312.1 MAG: 23S rRNA (uridine2552-2'-O)-methyltransferase [Candidatus Kentron sp. FM]VFK16622.1 MAG: 23S rRNA (uridine2552-2'-O)-methyltransferase [Candidatus Kentron sp. FM]